MSKLLIANWKSNKTPQLATDWCNSFSAKIPEGTTVVVAPSFSLLSTVERSLPDSVLLGAQDVSQMPMGSYTGAINAQQLQAHDVSYVLVGHSERRKYFHETNQDVALKIQQLVTNNLIPVLCLDEEYIDSQADALESRDIPGLVVAYEPLAAIGSGNNAPVDEVTRVAEKIKQTFGDVPIIYGGSVDERSVREYLMVTDGVLVGGASLDAAQFAKVVEASV